VIAANTGEAIQRLAGLGVIASETGSRLLHAWRVLSDVQQILRIAVDGEFSPETAPAPLLARLAGVIGASCADESEAKLRALQADVRADFLQIVGPPSDGNAKPSR
jgi:glutamate-ammonia-ligase adenylyltransferase